MAYSPIHFYFVRVGYIWQDYFVGKISRRERDYQLDLQRNIMFRLVIE